MKRILAGLTTTAGMALATAPALAQDICGGIGVGGQWIGGTESASDIAVASMAQQQMVLALSGNQAVSLFHLSAQTDVRVEAAGRGGGDPMFDLYDSAGILILSDDDSGGDSSARGEATLAPGDYCVAVSSFDGSPLTGYVRVGRTDQEALTTGMDSMADDTMTDSDSMDYAPEGMDSTAGCSTAPYFAGGPIDDQLGSGASFSSSVDQNAYWRFSLASPHAISITGTNESADPYLTLYDSMGNWLAENDDFNGLNSQIDMTSPLSPGEYCIQLQALSDTSQPIAVQITSYDPVAAMNTMYDHAEAAPPLDGSYPVTDLGVIPGRARQDVMVGSNATWFKVDIDDSGLLLVEAIDPSQSGDPMLFIFDDLGRKITENDDYGGTYDSLISARVTPGTYLIAVKQVGDMQSMTRMVFERYQPVR